MCILCTVWLDKIGKMWMDYTKTLKLLIWCGISATAIPKMSEMHITQQYMQWIDSVHMTNVKSRPKLMTQDNINDKITIVLGHYSFR